MSTAEGDVEVAEGSAAPAPVEVTTTMSVDDALQEVLKKALIHDGLARGLRESVKTLDKRQAHFCVMAESTDEDSVKSLIEALCNEHNIPLIMVPDGKELGRMVGLCKIDREGQPRKIVQLLQLLLPFGRNASTRGRTDASTDGIRLVYRASLYFLS